MIVLDKKNQVFTLHTRHTTYQMKADKYGVLLHTYYGPRLEGEDLSRLIRYADRGFCPNLAEAGHRRDYSLDTLPQEYSTSGVGDFRLPSIQLEREDGDSAADLRFTGCQVREGKYALEGLPAFHGEGGQTLAVTLEDKGSGVEVELLYGVFEDYDLITRTARVTNRGTGTVLLRQAASLCLDLPRADLDLITFDGRHMMERTPHRAPLRPGVQSVGSTRGASSHQHNPFVVLCERDADEDHGLCIGAMLLYSGNFQAAAERDPFENARLTLGIHPWRFCFPLAPGESFTAPEAALVLSEKGLTGMSLRFHRAIRERLLRQPADPKPVLVNSWEAAFFDFDGEKLVDLARASAPLGIELFVMDDGWFGRRDDDTSGLGDWFVNTDKLPGGLEALVPRVRELGMQFGIWVEPEMVSEDSDLFRAHPDWILGKPHELHARGRGQLVLDFSRKEVRDAVWEALAKVLRSADIRYVKWDMNRSLTEVWSAALPARRQGEVYHRFVLGVYDLLERLRSEFPHILVEGCGGGGGRFDGGMLYYTPQIWCSDNTDAVDRLGIQYGTSFCYPPCTMGAHVADSPSQWTGRSIPLETRGTAAMSGAFGYELDLTEATEEERAVIREQTAFYKAHRALLHDGDYYRLSDPFRDPFAAWEHVSPDRREALACVVFNPSHASPPFLTLRLKGLNPALRYRLDGAEEAVTGACLMEAGVPLPMPAGDYQSLRLYLRAE